MNPDKLLNLPFKRLLATLSILLLHAWMIGCTSEKSTSSSVPQTVVVVNQVEIEGFSTTFKVPFDIYVNGEIEVRDMAYGSSARVTLTGSRTDFEFRGDGFLAFASVARSSGGAFDKLIVTSERIYCEGCTLLQ